MLVADDGFDAARRQHVANVETLGGAEGHGLLHGDELGAAIDADPHHGGANRWQSAETKDVRARRRFGQFPASGDFTATPSLAAAAFEAGLVDIADAHHLKTAVGLKGGGMVHAALAHAHDDNPVFILHARPTVRSHSRALPIV